MFDHSLHTAYLILRTHQTVLIHNSQLYGFNLRKTKSHREAKNQNRMLLSGGSDRSLKAKNRVEENADAFLFIGFVCYIVRPKLKADFSNN